jgi:hypothetical protein
MVLLHENIVGLDAAIFMHPTVLLDIVLELNTILTIVVNGSQAIINFTTWEHEAIFLAMAYNFLKNIFLCHD